jgi:hypothetical protein
MPIPQWPNKYLDILRGLNRHVPAILIILALLLTGATAAAATSRMQPSDSIRVGNASGTLTTLIEYSNKRVLVGAGGSRSHAADFVGRATRPWDREIDLLILPGWDEHHVSGALGLIERRSVLGIAVIGLPDEHPLWTMLERESERRDIPLRYFARPSHVSLGKNGKLMLAETSGDGPGMIVRLDADGRRIDIVDAHDARSVEPPHDALPGVNRHVVVSSRSQQIPSIFSPELTIVPEAFWAGDYEGFSSPYRVSLARNESLLIELSENAISVPLESVDVRAE